jgi:hypothetical protein
MADSTGEADKGALRLDFDRRIAIAQGVKRRDPAPEIAGIWRISNRDSLPPEVIRSSNHMNYVDVERSKEIAVRLDDNREAFRWL